MNDQEFNDLFDDISKESIPKLDENAKKNAINTAKQEFSQAFTDSSRLIDNRDKPVSKFSQSIRRIFMSLINDKPNNSLFTGNAFATAAVAFVGISVFFMLPNFQTQEIVTTEEHATSVKPSRAASSTTEFGTNQIDIVKATANKPNNVTESNQAGPANLRDTLVTKAKPTAGSDVVATAQKRVESIQNTPITIVVGKSESESRANKEGHISEDKLLSEFTQLESKPAELQQVAPSLSTPTSQEIAAGDISIGLEETLVSRSAPRPAKRATVKQRSSLRENQSSVDYYAPSPQARPDLNEEYANKYANSISLVQDKPVSTFSIDVDTASYSLVRNQLNRGFLPKPSAVRAEEMINYFNYDYPLPNSKKQPFKPSISVLDSPWNDGKKLIHIGIKGYDIQSNETPDSNLVFLLDVSGSMNAANKLPLVKQSINLLLDTLKPSDTISIVVYAGAAGTALEPTKVSEKSKIISAIQRLTAGGSTAGAQGIELAYQLAEQNFNKNSVNRVILATDGDFNVGLRNNEDLKTLVERKRDKGVFLSVLGFGRNNYQDDMMQALAQNGNGVAAYIDTLSEAKKVLVDEATSTLFTIAKDVKIQIEFNPNTVSDYRLVGYETRALKREDFNNDKVDAGDIGAGHSVTAIYEITPTDSKKPSIDPLRYADKAKQVTSSSDSEYGFLKVRYKLPNEKKSKLLEQAITALNTGVNSDTQFSIAAAGFAQLLRNSQHTGDLNFEQIINTAERHKGSDKFGYRSEFIQLVRMAKIAK